MLLYLIQPISLMFCGHLGKTQLASSAMALSVGVYNYVSQHCMYLIYGINLDVKFYVSNLAIVSVLLFVVYAM